MAIRSIDGNGFVKFLRYDFAYMNRCSAILMVLYPVV